MTQEAYRPRCIKYSICFLKWGTPLAGVPPPSQVQQGGNPSQPSQVWWGVPEVGYPLGRTWLGYPLAGVPSLTRCNGGYPRWGTPQQGLPHVRGYLPPQLDLAGVPPPPPAGPGPDQVIPPPPRCGQTDGWMDGQTRVKTLPSRRTTYAVGYNRWVEAHLHQVSESTLQRCLWHSSHWNQWKQVRVAPEWGCNRF